jgi:O-antigen ligase
VLASPVLRGVLPAALASSVAVLGGVAAAGTHPRTLVALLTLSCLAVVAGWGFIRRNAGVFLGLSAGLVLMHGWLTSRGVDEQFWVAAFGLTLLAAVVLSLDATGPRGRRVDFALGVFALITVVSAATTVATYGLEHAARGARAWLLIPVLYWLGRKLALDRRTTNTAFLLVSFALAVVFAYGWKQFLLGYTESELALLDSQKYSTFVGDVPRVASTLATNQDLAAVLTVAVPALFAFAVARQRRRSAWMCIVILTTLGAALTLVGMVRTATVAALAGCTAVLAVSVQTRRGRVTASAVLIGLCGIALYPTLAGHTESTRAVRDRVATFTSLGSDDALRARVDRIWPSVIESIREKPLGHGVATTGGPALEVLPRSQVVTPDNGYLTVAYELGVQGLIAMGAFFLALLTRLFSAIRSAGDRSASPLTVGALGAGVALVVAMLSGSFIQLMSLQLLFFLLAGAGVTACARRA